MSHLNTESLDRIRGLASEVAEREGCALYDIEWLGAGGSRILRVFIDKASGGASVDDCANVSRGLNLILDVEDVIPSGRYDLEVSTPGIERRLSQPWHFDKAVGQRVRVKTHGALSHPEREGKAPLKSIEGDLLRTDEVKIVIQFNNLEWDIPRSEIQSGKVIFVTKTPNSPSKKKKRG